MNKEGKLKVKLINCNSPQILEEKINEFLSRHPVEIVKIDFQVTSGSKTSLYMYSALITYYEN